jgi:uncharacterized cupin superfamily protein
MVATLRPVKLNGEHIAGRQLQPLGPWPTPMQLRPIATHRVITWYTGEKLTSQVYDADDGLLQFVDLPYDEFVRVLNGTAILTSADGLRQVFEAGDHFIVPKGWTGTWELKNGYRELIVFETKSLEHAVATWFGTSVADM